MISWPSFLSVAHLLGFSLAAGAATVKLVLLLRCTADPTLVPGFIKVAKPITRQIMLGMIVLTLSGIGWFFLGYGLTPRLIAKIVLVAAIWVLGPVIDKVVEPRFQKLAPGLGTPASPEFARIQRQYVMWETTATSLFYVIIFIWVLRS